MSRTRVVPTLAELLAHAQAQGWSDYAIAKELGVSRAHISGVRNGRHGLSWAKARHLEELGKAPRHPTPRRSVPQSPPHRYDKPAR